MNGLSLPLLIAGWGALLSTALAAIKIWELWRDRHRIDVGYSFCSDEQQGNTITIRNVSGRPLILCYWELQLRHGHWPRARYNTFRTPEPDEVNDYRLEPYSSYPLVFTDYEHFDYDLVAPRGGPVYIRLHFAGRRPMRLIAYPGS
ncbi:hypothetical protein [Burkholderia cenocepacia]|jgi:hypothetical protein|uniref:DUF3592 domain-containing protein n=2 Tax=Burkholderia cepacia complex TaxID=87882 RepID=A0ABD4UFJ9_9BURK|nr:hypothetical protein [Burkholderia cenocepacia]MCW3696781.1 hypothetical protein [Burkholderia cenocepacia]MCW3704998.1 hypothetical protein [Burkholderia cenocepacia]MCW3713257.1 hypothetical protein [Burkholderia cenocepacia]MCW3721806.1 hypothetical protein [Burkholderia cenocepacia]MCW3729249.1 hypothetical protein [Burkholderia cenocepacia]